MNNHLGYFSKNVSYLASFIQITQSFDTYEAKAEKALFNAEENGDILLSHFNPEIETAEKYLDIVMNIIAICEFSIPAKGELVPSEGGLSCNVSIGEHQIVFRNEDENRVDVSSILVPLRENLKKIRPTHKIGVNPFNGDYPVFIAGNGNKIDSLKKVGLPYAAGTNGWLGHISKSPPEDFGKYYFKFKEILIDTAIYSSLSSISNTYTAIGPTLAKELFHLKEIHDMLGLIVNGSCCACFRFNDGEVAFRNDIYDLVMMIALLKLNADIEVYQIQHSKRIPVEQKKLRKKIDRILLTLA